MDGSSTLLPLARFPVEKRRDVRVVMTDIDDTLTDEGKLTAAAYDALERLKSAGLVVIPVTGRPAGWCDMIARFWPVDAVVGENGAFYFRYDAAAKRMIRRYAKSDLERARDRKKLADLAVSIPRDVPGSALIERTSAMPSPATISPSVIAPGLKLARSMPSHSASVALT